MDYLSDCLFHGLYSLFGDQIVDCNRIWYMWEADPGVRAQLYGKGFTVTGLLSEDTTDREDIEKKIAKCYFDWVFYGSIHRSQTHLDLVLDSYPRNRIVAFDGEDHGMVREIGIPYFKRELHGNDPDIFPISFAIPGCKIRQSVPREKSQLFATVVPGNRDTYVFDIESEYYADYAASYFGRTQRKSGWDCLRHYEILASGCIPYFPELELCPPRIMTTFPKAQVMESNRLPEAFRSDEYWDALESLFNYTQEHLTTTALARSVLDTLKGLGFQM